MVDEPAMDAAFQAEKLIPAEFEIQEQLGAGGYGFVYKAVHRSLGQVVAIKFIRSAPGAVDQIDFVRFKKELRAIAKLNHPNIVKVLQVGSCKDSTPFIVYEYLQGLTLQSYLDSHENISPHALSVIMDQVCEGLSYVHSVGMVHKDVKPGNIMILSKSASSFTEVKLLDFGLARSLRTGQLKAESDPEQATNSESGETTTTRTAGSPAYMSPEQCNGEDVDGRSDIYSLACVVFRCLTGRVLFEGDTPFHILYQQVNQKPPLPDKSLSGKLNHVLLQALAKNRADRQASVQEFHEQLQAALKELKDQSKFTWTITRQKIQVLSFLIVLLLGILLLVSQSYKKAVVPAQVSRPTLLQHSRTSGIFNNTPEHRLKAAIDQNTLMENTRDPDRTTKMIKALNDLIPDLKNNKRLLYMAYEFKATVEMDKNSSWENASPSFKSCLELCRMKQGMAVQAVRPYTMLALLSLNKGDRPAAEFYATEAVKLAESCGEHPEQTLSLDLPEYYQCVQRGVNESTSNYILATLAMERKQYQRALTYAKKSANLSPPWLSNSANKPFVMVAEVYLLMKEENRAREFIQQSLQIAFDIFDGKASPSALDFQSFDRGDALNAIFEAGRMFESHGYYKDARHLYQRVLDHADDAGENVTRETRTHLANFPKNFR